MGLLELRQAPHVDRLCMGNARAGGAVSHETMGNMGNDAGRYKKISKHKIITNISIELGLPKHLGRGWLQRPSA